MDLTTHNHTVTIVLTHDVGARDHPLCQLRLAETSGYFAGNLISRPPKDMLHSIAMDTTGRYFSLDPMKLSCIHTFLW